MTIRNQRLSLIKFVDAYFNFLCWISLSIFGGIGFVLAYLRLFGVPAEGDLINPLMVIMQASMIFFLVAHKNEPFRKFLLNTFCISLLACLFLKGLKLTMIVLLYMLFLPILILDLIPSNFLLCLLFSLCFLNPNPFLAQWGFDLVIQAVEYLLLVLFFKKENFDRKDFFILLCLLSFFYFFGFFYYSKHFLENPIKLVILMSGACTVFLCIKNRERWEFYIPLLLFILMGASAIAVFSPPIPIGGVVKYICGIPEGLVYFILLYIFIICFFILVRNTFPNHREYPFPMVLGGVLVYIANFKHFPFLDKWLEGLGLLLILVSFFSAYYNEEEAEKKWPSLVFPERLKPSAIRDIMADHVHHELTRNLVLVYLRLFLLIVIKDVFLSFVL